MNAGVLFLRDDLPVIQGDENRTAAVSVLFQRSGPPTISGAIAFGVFNTLKGFALRALSHVSKKVRELAPPNAYFDSLGSVSFVAWVFGVPAPLKHGRPTSISRGFASGPLGMPMLGNRFQREAPAATRWVNGRGKRPAAYLFTAAAVTDAVPINLWPAMWGLRNHCQPTKSYSIQGKFVHGQMLSHQEIS